MQSVATPPTPIKLPSLTLEWCLHAAELQTKHLLMFRSTQPAQTDLALDFIAILEASFLLVHSSPAINQTHAAGCSLAFRAPSYMSALVWGRGARYPCPNKFTCLVWDTLNKASRSSRPSFCKKVSMQLLCAISPSRLPLIEFKTEQRARKVAFILVPTRALV